MTTRKHPEAATDVRAATELKTEFEQRATKWKQDTAHLSSPSMIAEHRAYQEIIGMGKEAIPMILRDLEETRAPVVLGAQTRSPESLPYGLKTVATLTL